MPITDEPAPEEPSALRYATARIFDLVGQLVEMCMLPVATPLLASHRRVESQLELAGEPLGAEPEVALAP